MTHMEGRGQLVISWPTEGAHQMYVFPFLDDLLSDAQQATHLFFLHAR